jgi:hypothetical protein
LGRRRRRYSSREAFVASLHQRRRDDRHGCPSSYQLQDEGQTPTKSASPASSSRPEAPGNSAHCNGPYVHRRVTGLIYNSFSIMTVCNLPLWEYSGYSPVPEGINVLAWDVGHSSTYKYPRTVPLRGQINRAIVIPR